MPGRPRSVGFGPIFVAGDERPLLRGSRRCRSRPGSGRAPRPRPAAPGAPGAARRARRSDPPSDRWRAGPHRASRAAGASRACLYRPWILGHRIAVTRPGGRRPSGCVGTGRASGGRAARSASARCRFAGTPGGPAVAPRRWRRSGPRGGSPSSVRMKRSAQPLPSGARTKAGEDAAPSQAISRWKSRAMYWLSMVVADAEACGHVLANGSEALDHALPDRLERLVARPAQRRVDACALRRAMIHRDEHRDLAMLRGEARRHVIRHRPRTDGGRWLIPHRVDPLGDDRAVVVARAAGAAHPARRREAVLTHQAAHALLGGAQAPVAQPRPDLAVALAVEGALGQHPPDRRHEADVVHRSQRSWPPSRRRRHVGGSAQSVDARARDAPDPADAGDAVSAARGDRDDGAHRAGVRGAKGAPPSSRSTFA